MSYDPLFGLINCFKDLKHAGGPGLAGPGLFSLLHLNSLEWNGF